MHWLYLKGKFIYALLVIKTAYGIFALNQGSALKSHGWFNLHNTPSNTWWWFHDSLDFIMGIRIHGNVLMASIKPGCDCWSPGVLCNIGYPSENPLKLKSCEISFVHDTYLSIIQSFRNFAQSTAVSLPCSVQNFETIGLLINKW